MKYVFTILMLIVLSACTVDSSRQQRAELDSLSTAMTELKNRLDSIEQVNPGIAQSEPDTSVEKNSVQPKETIKNTPYTTPLPQHKKTPTPQPIPKIDPADQVVDSSRKKNSDTLYHYYSHGPLSAMRTPFVDGYAKWYLYDLKGEVTCEFEEARHSFTVSVDFQFHPNGAIRKATVRTNPGASLYYYEAVVECDQTNNPGWMRKMKYPADLEDYAALPWYWDKRSRSWVQQEVVIEQDTPGN